MTINELLTNSKSQFSLDVFSAKGIAAVEAALTEKEGSSGSSSRSSASRPARHPISTTASSSLMTAAAGTSARQ
jgi:hypothetical protein